MPYPKAALGRHSITDSILKKRKLGVLGRCERWEKVTDAGEQVQNDTRSNRRSGAEGLRQEVVSDSVISSKHSGSLFSLQSALHDSSTLTIQCSGNVTYLWRNEVVFWPFTRHNYFVTLPNSYVTKFLSLNNGYSNTTSNSQY